MVSTSKNSLTLPMSRMIIELYPPCMSQVGCMRVFIGLLTQIGLLECKLLGGVNIIPKHL